MQENTCNRLEDMNLAALSEFLHHADNIFKVSDFIERLDAVLSGQSSGWISQFQNSTTDSSDFRYLFTKATKYFFN